MIDGSSAPLVARLRRLAPGRHYAGSPDSGCWAMIGRDVRDVDEWSILPPNASLTLAWGEGGCAMRFDGGGFDVAPGQCMWVDAGFAHRGRNLPGSDFLTLFVADDHARAAGLHLLPIGAAVAPAPPHIAGPLLRLALMLLDGSASPAEQLPLIDAILDWVGTRFEPRDADRSSADPIRCAADQLDEDGVTIAAVARELGLSPSALSRRFKARHQLTPQAFRKQLRLAAATRALAGGASVTEAAHGAGFADAAHLTRSFRAQYGIAPSGWSRRVARAGRPG